MLSKPLKRLIAGAGVMALALAAPGHADAHGGWGGRGGWGGGWHGGGGWGWRGGFYGGLAVGIGLPYAYGYPYSYSYPYPYPYPYPPPAYSYAPSYPYYYYAAPAAAPYAPSSQPPPGYTCDAGRYVCPLQVVHPVNGACNCPTGNGGWIQGTAR
jgi:hypothetical protein